MLTAWDFPTAKILEEAGIDYILVGDSLSMSILGFTDTKSVTIADMVHHTKAVKRAVRKTPIIADMPINTYNNVVAALTNAKRLLQAGATMIKIEGNKKEVVNALLAQKIPVVGHLGLLPQTATTYSVQGREKEEAEKILKDAKELDALGIQLLILECIPEALAKKITQTIHTPTIGIGAGIFTSGQVLVLSDILGLSNKKLKMAKQYVNVTEIIKQAVLSFQQDVEKEKFPGKEHTFL